MSDQPGDPGFADAWCIHFRDASRNDTCKVGVRYDSFPQPRFKTQPCFLTNPGEKAPCEYLRPPTTDEVEAHKAWFQQHMDRLFTVMNGISQWRKDHKGKSAAEIVECPACKGRLQLSISSSNGHVHGHCQTDGCVSWME